MQTSEYNSQCNIFAFSHPAPSSLVQGKKSGEKMNGLHDVVDSEQHQLRLENERLRNGLAALESVKVEAETNFRASDLQTSRFEEDIRSINKKMKAKEAECENLTRQKISLEAQLGAMQAAVLLSRQGSVQDAQTSFSLDSEPVLLISPKNSQKAEQSDDSDLRCQLQECQFQLVMYCERFKQAATGWEKCEDKARAREQRVVELEFQLESQTAKVADQERLIEDLHVLSTKLSEQLALESSINVSLKSDLDIQKSTENRIREDLLQSNLQTSLAHECQAEEIARLSGLLLAETNKGFSLEHRLKDLSKVYDDTCMKCTRLEKECAELAARLVRVEQNETSSKADMALAVEELRTTTEGHVHWQREYESLRMRTDEALQAQSGDLMLQSESFREQLRFVSSALERCEARAVLAERRCEELESQLKSMAYAMTVGGSPVSGSSQDNWNAHQVIKRTVSPGAHGTASADKGPGADQNTGAGTVNDILQSWAEDRDVLRKRDLDAVEYRAGNYARGACLSATGGSSTPGLELLSAHVVQNQIQTYRMQLRQAAAGWEACEARAAAAHTASERRVAALEAELALAAANATDQAALIEELQQLSTLLSDQIASSRLVRSVGLHANVPRTSDPPLRFANTTISPANDSSVNAVGSFGGISGPVDCGLVVPHPMAVPRSHPDSSILVDMSTMAAALDSEGHHDDAAVTSEGLGMAHFRAYGESQSERRERVEQAHAQLDRAVRVLRGRTSSNPAGDSDAVEGASRAARWTKGSGARLSPAPPELARPLQPRIRRPVDSLLAMDLQRRETGSQPIAHSRRDP